MSYDSPSAKARPMILIKASQLLVTTVNTRASSRYVSIRFPSTPRGPVRVLSRRFSSCFCFGHFFIHLNEDGVTACRESTILIQFKKNTPKNSFYHSTNKEHPLPNNSTNNPKVGLPLRRRGSSPHFVRLQ